MSDSVWPHRWQPTSLPRPWDSPGKNTGVGCHFFLQCMKVKSESEVAQSCPTLHDPMDCSLPGSSVYGIFQARVLEWGAIAFSNYLYINANKKFQTTVNQYSISKAKKFSALLSSYCLYVGKCILLKLLETKIFSKHSTAMFLWYLRLVEPNLENAGVKALLVHFITCLDPKQCLLTLFKLPYYSSTPS